MKILYLSILIFVASLLPSVNNNQIYAQDIPELHMIIFQGDIQMISSSDNASELDGLLLEAKIDGNTVASVEIGSKLSTRYSGLEVGPNKDLEGKTVTFWVGNQQSLDTAIFGPTTATGDYCKGCTWSLPISKSLNLRFNSVPLPTPTPEPESVEPSFLTGTVIFGSVLSAPDGITTIQAYIGDKLVGNGTMSGSNFSITIDPGTELYVGKTVKFFAADAESKTLYAFIPDDFQTEFKLFFPEFVPTPTPMPEPTAPAPTSTPEPTRTPTPMPEPTATYTPTATPTPIVMTTSSDLIIEEDTGGCNSRGGGAASLSLIILSAAPLYLLNRRKRKFN